MYLLLLALYLIYTLRDNFKLLSEVEGGIAAFTKWDWVIVGITALEIPVVVICVIRGIKELRAGRLEQEAKREEEAEKAREEAIAKYELEAPVSDESLLWEDETEGSGKKDGNFNIYDE